MFDAVAALPFGVALKQLTHLEEQHHEHRLGELFAIRLQSFKLAETRPSSDYPSASPQNVAR